MARSLLSFAYFAAASCISIGVTLLARRQGTPTESGLKRDPNGISYVSIPGAVIFGALSLSYLIRAIV